MALLHYAIGIAFNVYNCLLLAAKPRTCGLISQMFDNLLYEKVAEYRVNNSDLRAQMSEANKIRKWQYPWLKKFNKFNKNILNMQEEGRYEFI